MGTYLMARIIEGTDKWYSYGYKQGIGNFDFSEVKNEDLTIRAACNQTGFNKLYDLGKALWNAGKCTKFEIAAFDDYHLFWKTRPDKSNFAQNKYNDCFNRMIDEELKSFRSDDFQNDKLEMAYVKEYQQKFWPRSKTERAYGTEAFKFLLNDTRLYEDLAAVRNWIETKEKESMNSDMSFIPREHGFESRGQFILNPFFDETLRFPVEPISYYGTKNMNQFLSGLKKHIAAETQKHIPLDDKLQVAQKHKDSLSLTHTQNNPSLSRE